MCLGSGARNANKAARRQYEHQLKVRKKKHLNKLAKYGQLKNQYDKNLTNIYQGYRHSISQGQVVINNARAAMLRGSETALIKAAQNSKYGNLLAKGRTGRSIERIGVSEAGALGRFYAAQGRKLSVLKDKIRDNNIQNRRKMINAQDKAFASVAFNPQADLAPPRPVMQNVGWAMFTDALSIAGSVASIGTGFGGGEFWKNAFI